MESNWKQERSGKFTASEIHRLMTSGRSKDQLFGQTAMTYIREVAAESLMGEPIETRETEAMAWGKQWESSAVAAFEEKYGFSLKYYGSENPKFFEHPNFPFAGCSTDAESGQFVLEAKCPHNPANHVDLLEISTDAFRQAELLKKDHYDYWCQVQFNMIVRRKFKGYLISYDPRMEKESHKLAVIELDLCIEFKEEVEKRLGEAKKKIAELFKKIN